MNRIMKCVRIALVFALLASPAMLLAADEGWKDTAELSYVMTSGNTETSTLGFKNTLTRAWERSGVTFKAGGIKVENTEKTFAVVDTMGTVVQSEVDKTTAENYYLNGRYDRTMTERSFWFVGAGWERNEFAGFDNRYIGEAGVGNIWRDDDDVKFSTRYALTYTKQDDIVEVPGVDDSFLGARFAWDYSNKLSANTTYMNNLVLDLNLDETSDWRGDMINSLQVSMSDRVALKVSLQWLYDAEPSFASIDYLDAMMMPATAIYEIDDLDSIFTASLVVNF